MKTDAINLNKTKLIQPSVKSMWITDIRDDVCTIGSGDYALADGIPLNIGRLIAAAPDMLAALQALIALTDKCDPDGLFRGLEDIRARKAIAKAIAKATGQNP